MKLFDFMLIYIHHFFELAACITVVYLYKYLRKSFMKWFLPFLILVCVGEIIAHIYWLSFYMNYIIGIAEAVFYGFIFYNLIEGRRSKLGIIFLMTLVIIIYFITYAFFDTRPYLTYFFKNLIFFGFLMTVISLGYLFQLFRKDDRIVKDPGFWIALGVIVFFSGTSIVFSLYTYGIKNNLYLFGEGLHRIIPRFLSVLLYGSFIVSILMCRKDEDVSLEAKNFV
jgi:hypothetical protein